MKDTAVRYQQAGVPIGGIGVQGHMHDIDLTLVQVLCYLFIILLLFDWADVMYRNIPRNYKVCI